MFISQEDRNKRAQLNKLVERLCALSQEFDLESNYGPKFSTIVENAAKKLVDCDAKLPLVFREVTHYNYNGPNKKVKEPLWQLRRDGLVRAFGSGDKFKNPKYDDQQWAINFMHKNWGSELVELPLIKADVEKLANSKNKAVQNKEGLKELAILLGKIQDTKLGMDSETEENFFGIKLNMPCQLTIPGEEDNSTSDRRWMNSKRTTPLIVESFELTLEAHGLQMNFIEKGTKEGYSFANGVNGRERVCLVEYISLSEEPTYSFLVNTLQQAIKTAEEKLAENTKVLNKILEDYGQYLVLAEL